MAVRISKCGTILEKVTADEIINGGFPFPASITTIAKDCFSGVEGLKNLEIPPTVRKIEANAVTSCPDLKTVVIGDGSDSQEDPIQLGKRAFYGNTKLKHLKIKANLRELPEECLAKCSSLEEVLLPRSIETIYPLAFFHCSALKRLVFSNEKMLRLRPHALTGCPNLETVFFLNGYSHLLDLDRIFGTTYPKDIKIPKARDLKAIQRYQQNTRSLARRQTINRAVQAKYRDKAIGEAKREAQQYLLTKLKTETLPTEITESAVSAFMIKNQTSSVITIGQLIDVIELPKELQKLPCYQQKLNDLCLVVLLLKKVTAANPSGFFNESGESQAIRKLIATIMNKPVKPFNREEATKLTKNGSVDWLLKYHQRGDLLNKLRNIAKDECPQAPTMK